MTWWQIAGVVAPALMAIATVIGALFARKTGKEANEAAVAASLHAGWEGLAREQREWIEDRLHERDKRIDALEGKVTTLQDRLEDIETKYRHAVAYIRRLVAQLQRHVDADQIETPPPTIHSDL